MKNGLVGFIVRRYLRFDPSQPFITIAAILAFLGVTLGVTVLIVAMAIMSGFIKEFGEKLFIMNYPITVQPRYYEAMSGEMVDRMKKRFPDLKFSPFLRAGAMSRKGSAMEGNIVFGVDFESEKAVNPVFARAIEAGKTYKPFDAIAGKALADEFGLTKGEKLLMIFTRAQPIGLALAPTMKRFTIAEQYESGLHEFDKAYFYAQADDLRAILGLEGDLYHGVHIYADDPQAAIGEIADFIGDDYRAIGWWEKNASFFASFELEKRALFIVLMLIVLVAAMNIISSQMMTVLSRRKEIALLMSLGASAREIGRIFFTTGVIIGVGGIALGSALGFSALWALSTFDIISLPPEVYGTSKLPLHFTPIDYLTIAIGAFAIVIFSSWFPARKAAKTDALDTLRNE